MGRGLPYCEWRNWLERGVGDCPLVMRPQCNVPPGAELGTPKTGVHKHPGLPDTPMAARHSSPIHLVTPRYCDPRSASSPMHPQSPKPKQLTRT